MIWLVPALNVRFVVVVKVNAVEDTVAEVIVEPFKLTVRTLLLLLEKAPPPDHE